MIEPDAILLGLSNDDREPDAVLIEYDRTRRPSKQKEKLRRYDSFLGETWRECRYAAHPHKPAVIWICAAEAQLKSFVKATDPQPTSAIVRRPVGHTGYPVKARSSSTSAASSPRDPDRRG